MLSERVCDLPVSLKSSLGYNDSVGFFLKKKKKVEGLKKAHPTAKKAGQRKKKKKLHTQTSRMSPDSPSRASRKSSVDTTLSLSFRWANHRAVVGGKAWGASYPKRNPTPFPSLPFLTSVH